jgi:predicted dehydrogenase
LPSNQASIFYRKPISNTLAEAEEIIALAKEYNVKGQRTCGAI